MERAARAQDCLHKPAIGARQLSFFVYYDPPMRSTRPPVADSPSVNVSGVDRIAGTQHSASANFLRAVLRVQVERWNIEWMAAISTYCAIKDPLRPTMKRLSSAFLPLVSIHPDAPVALRRQLYEWFRQAIAEGRLSPGQRVPSTRSLARELGVSRTPVVCAYDQLLAEGYLQSYRGAGTCIAVSISESIANRGSKEGRTAARRSGMRKPSQRATNLLTLPEERQLSTASAFRVSMPALDSFPQRAWGRWVSRHARKASLEDMAYGDPMGEPGLRESISQYLRAVRGVRCDPTQIMITAGSQQGLLITLRALLDPGDVVWVEEPGYPGAHRVLALNGCATIPVPLDGEGLIVEEGVRRSPAARAAYVTPSHQYPMGMSLSAGRRIQLLNWASRAGGWILEDDYDSEYRFGAQPIASLQGLDSADRVIYSGTFSKVLFPALRIGYLVVPKDLVGAFRATRDATDIFPPTLYQRVLTEMLREGHFARHIRKMRGIYAERRERLIAALQRQFRDTLEIVSADAGLHLVLRLPPGVDDKDVVTRANSAGIACAALSACCLEPPSRGGLILGYGGVPPHRIDDAARRLGSILRESLNCTK
jgi:GntR family transcriptional regulator / MocR family aminotransferase